MFEKLSQAMKGNQNARKNPLKVGLGAGVGASALGTMAGIGKHVKANADAIKSFRIAGKYGTPAARATATKVLKAAAKDGAKAGFRGTGALAVGLGVGAAVSQSAMNNRKVIAKKAKALKDSISNPTVSGVMAAKGAALLTAGAIGAGIVLKDKGMLRRAARKVT